MTIATELRELARVASAMAEQQYVEQIRGLVSVYHRALINGHRLFFAGNGGSAADAQHIAAEYVVRLGRERAALAALALTVDTSILTACANDYHFERVFARQIEALGQPGDVLTVHSTSGQSENLLHAVVSAAQRDMVTVALLGKTGGQLALVADVALVVPSHETSHIQELHLAIQHIVCAEVERALYG